jgi:hypothetical protein
VHEFICAGNAGANRNGHSGKGGKRNVDDNAPHRASGELMRSISIAVPHSIPLCGIRRGNAGRRTILEG